MPVPEKLELGLLSLVAMSALVTGCERGCGSSAPTPASSVVAPPSASSAPLQPPIDLALLDHFPGRVAFSPGGHQLASLGHHELVIWDVESGVPVHVLAGKGEDLAWSPDGKRISVADRGSIRTYDLADDTVTTPLVSDESATRVAGLGWVNGGELAAFLENGELVRLPDDKPPARIRVFARGVERVAFDSTRERVAVAPKEPSLPLELAQGSDFGKREALPWGGRDNAVLGLSFSPDGTRLAGLDNRVSNGLTTWDTTTRKALPPPRAPSGRVNDFAWSPDSQRLALAGHDSGIHVIAVKNGEVLRSRPLPEWSGDGVDWSPDGRSLAVTWRALTLHDADTLEPTARLWMPPDDSTHLACARALDSLVAVGKGGDLVEWNLARGELHAHPELAVDAFQVTWTAGDERWVVVAKHEVRVIDAKSAKVVDELALELPATERDVPSPDGKWLAQLRPREVAASDAGAGTDGSDPLPADLPPPPQVSGNRKGVEPLGLPNLRPHLLLRSIPDGALRDLGLVAGSGVLTFSADAKRLAVITDRGIEIFDVLSGKAVTRITTPTHGLGPMGSRYDPFAALSPDGAELVAPGPGFSELEVWRASDGSRARKLRGFGGDPLVWAADGESIATAGGWWAANDGRALAKIQDGLHQAPCIGPKGRWLAVASERDIQIVRRDGRSLRLRRIPVRLGWSAFVWQSQSGFDGDDEAIRRVWLARRGEKPSPATDHEKLRQRGLLRDFVRDAQPRR